MAVNLKKAKQPAKKAAKKPVASGLSATQSRDVWRAGCAVMVVCLLALAWTESPCERPDGTLEQTCDTEK